MTKGSNDPREELLGLLVQVGHLDARGEDGIVGVLRGEGRGRLSGKFVEFHGGHAGIYSLDDLLGDDGLVDKLHQLSSL